MAEIRLYIQPRFPAAVNQTAFYDFSKHVEFDSLQWEQNDQGAASVMQANVYSIMPVSETRWYDYPGANEAAKIQAALDDQFYRLKIYPRTEVQIRDVSTTPHTILWGGVITRVAETRDGGSINGSIEAIDYTALLNEVVALEYTPLGNSTIKQTITSSSYSFPVSRAERTAGLSELTVSSIAIGSPYNRNLETGDTIVVELTTVGGVANDTFNGVHKIIGVTTEAGGTYDIRFQQYSNVADVVNSAAAGAAVVPGFMTTQNAPQLDSRIVVAGSNVADLNPDWKWSPRNPGITRSVANVTRTGTTATITTTAGHGFGIGGLVTIALTNGPAGYAALNGTYVITATPTQTTFTYTTSTTGGIVPGAAVGTAVAAGEITPTPMKGGTIARNLQYAVDKGNGCFFLNAGSLDISGNHTIQLFVKRKTINDIVTNGLFEGGSSTGWSLGSWQTDAVGNTGPYGVGNTVYYTGSDHQDAEMAPAYRIPVSEGEKYFVSWRHYSDKDAKEKPRMKFYDSLGNVVGNAHGVQINQTGPIDDEWHKDWGIIIVPSGVATMSFVLHHESFSSSYTARFTDIQIIKITGAFGFSDHPIEDTATYGMPLKDFETPSAPEESGESANRIYVYAPYTDEDPLSGAKKITSYRNTYDFVQGVWESGGKRIEGSIVELQATDAETALLTAQSYFRNSGQSLRSFEFDHISGALQVGDVVPFIWKELGIAEALVVRRQSGYLIGQDVYYRVQLGGDIGFERSTMYLVERRLKEVTGDAAYFSPPPSPYPGYPTEGGIVTPAKPIADAGAEKVDLAWEYPQSLVNSTSFGGFVVLRSGDGGTTWNKASTGEVISAAQNPLSPDSAVPNYTDSQVTASTTYIYKVAAVDVSTATPILTDYSSDSDQATPTSPSGVDFDTAYSGLGINVPKVVASVTYPGAGVEKAISTITSGVSTTATVTTSSAHGFSTGYVVGITGAVGTNNGDVNGGFYSITVTSSTAFTITKTGTNALSLSGGKANGWEVSNAFSVYDSGVSGPTTNLTLPNAQYPVGQLVYSQGDGKIYRNGKHGTDAFNDKWTRASVDAIDVTSDGSVVISADRITTGSLDAGRIQTGTLNASLITVTNLSASSITTGTLSATRISGGTFDASTMTVTNLSASSINTGTLSASRISGGTLDASTITVTNLSANSITSGTLSADRISGGTLSGITLDITGAATFSNKTTGTTSPAIVTKGSVSQGDVAAASGAILHLGATDAASANAGGTFVSRLQLESTYANFRDSIVRAKQFDFHESDADANTGTRRATIRGSATAAGRLVVENNAGSGDVVLYVDGQIEQVNSATIGLTINATGAGSITTLGGIYCNDSTTGGVAFRSGATVVGRISYTDAANQGLYFTNTRVGTANTTIAYWSTNAGAAYLNRPSSSIKYKEDVVPVDFDMEDIVALSPVNFKIKEEYRNKDEHGNFTRDSLETQLGIIAEHGVGNAAWEKLVVIDDDTGEVGAWAYQNMGIVLLSAVRQLYAKNKELETRIAELEA